MTTKLVDAGSLKEGGYVLIDGVACKILSMQVSRPGKHGHAKIRMEGIGLIDNKRRIIVMPGHDNMEVPIVEKKNAQVLSVANNVANVMDTETFETFDLQVPDEMKGTCISGITVMYWRILDDKIMKQLKGGE
ncbi:MAG: translation initiation factor IF-5A [Candidatus Woesearchaeota archaeon]